MDEIDKIKNLKNMLWVVYPAGTAGDWLSYLISRHFSDWGGDVDSPEKSGKINFIGSDRKFMNDYKTVIQKGPFDFSDLSDGIFFEWSGLTCDFFQEFENGYWSIMRNKEYSDVSQLILSNHYFETIYIRTLLRKTSWKFIRIMPYSKEEKEFVFRSCMQKLVNQPWLDAEVDIYWKMIDTQKPINDARVLELSLSDIVLESKWQNTYSKIKEHLNINIDLIDKKVHRYYYKLQPQQLKDQLDILDNVP